MKTVKILPIDPIKGEIFEIASNDVSYFTHGFFKYPCKFIPQIPRWAIKKYTKKGDVILDPFIGSGTTAVEAVLLNRNALGVDFDELSKLLSKVKTKQYSKQNIRNLKKSIVFFESNEFKTINLSIEYPNIKNLFHWFSEENAKQLLLLKNSIFTKYGKEEMSTERDFLLVVFASIIRKSSKADDVSPKPYVSRKIKKKTFIPYNLFIKNLKTYVKELENKKYFVTGTYVHIGDDARLFTNKRKINCVDLAITSPPYINAFDYVRSLRLENVWLGFSSDSLLLQKKKKQIGTESISSSIYKNALKKTGIKSLDKDIEKIFKVDKKRAHIVYEFFLDMEKNIQQVEKMLKSGGHYIIVVGNSEIRGIQINTTDYLIKIAERNGFVLKNKFAYLIKNRYLRIPRSGRGGLIKHDWVVDIEKHTYGKKR